jgi:threonine synthase
MKFISTSGKAKPASFREAVLQGLAPDGGLYVPQHIPVLDEETIRKFSTMTVSEIAFVVLQPYLADDFTAEEIELMVKESLTMPFPLKQVAESVWALELFHGPTLAFKDVGARFLAQVLKKIVAHTQTQITILTATSGDTGSAVAHAFYNVPGVKVVVLYPDGRISAMQEKQIATWGGNIQAIRVGGSFDDCQRMVKEAFADAELKQQLGLTSANSINLARWLPQAIYYFYAWSRLGASQPVVFSVPSGNFGNLAAGMLAYFMGLPSKWVAATNVNDVVPEYLRTGVFRPRTSEPTISNAMDVGNPSNFSRLLYLFDQAYSSLATSISGYAFTDEQTRTAISNVYHQWGYVLDPHGAVAWLGLQAYLQKNAGIAGVFLATAHPAKFKNVVEACMDKPLSVPESITSLLNRPITSCYCHANIESLKDLLLDSRSNA